MWRNHLVLTLRLLARNKLYAFVNLFGLALGLAACLLILIYVRYESSYDSALPEAERVFQLQNWFVATEQGPAGANRMTSFASGTALRKDFPEIETLVYVGNNQPVIVQNGEASISKNFYFTDGPLFDVLQFPFLHGDRKGSLSAPGQMVLTESEARRRFGTSDAVGRTLTLMIAGKPVDYRVSGVIRDPPRNSHIQLSIVARYDPQAFWSGSNFLTDWLPKNGWVYFKLRPGADVEQMRRRMPAWEKRNIPDELVGGQRAMPARPTTGSWSRSATSISAKRRAPPASRATIPGRSPQWRWSGCSYWAWRSSTSPTSPPPGPGSAPAKWRCARWSAPRAAS